jgi:hypothetical protein
MHVATLSSDYRHFVVSLSSVIACILSDEYLTSFGFYWVKKMNDIFSDEYLMSFGVIGFYWVLLG